jgi:hypothetical protein
MSDPKFFRKYLDIISEAPASENNPSQFQQVKSAVGQQYDNYKNAASMADDAAKQGLISKDGASSAKGDIAGAMVRGGWEAGKAAMSGRDPETAYLGSMFKTIGDKAANSGIDDFVKKSGPEISKYRGPNAQDITKDPSYLKASPEKQAQIVKAQQSIRDLSDDDYAHLTGGNAIKQAAAQATAAGQSMIDQKDSGKMGASGYSSKANQALGLDPTRQATDAELDAVATKTPQTPVQEEDEELDRIKKLIRK